MYRQVVQTSRQSLIDLVVALVSVPLLVVFGLLLESNMRGDWTRDEETRWYVLSLGIVLMFVSIMVCGYVTHRLGICIWAVAQEPGRPRHESNVSFCSSSGAPAARCKVGQLHHLGILTLNHFLNPVIKKSTKQNFIQSCSFSQRIN